MNTTNQIEERQHLLETAQIAAVQAGELLREKLNQPRQLSSKGFRDLVTDADFAAQQIITDLIHGRFPHHGFLNEEDSPKLPTSGSIIWVIDPVDGTSNYSRQQPNFSVSIAAAVPDPASNGSQSVMGRKVPDCKVIVGVVYDPMRDEMFTAVAGQGSYLNGRRIETSAVDDLSQSIVALDWGHSHEKRTRMLATLNHFAHKVQTLRAIGSAALALSWIAAGRLDGYMQFALGPWDAAAGSLLILEAGGQISNVEGRPWTLADPDCVASNGPIHEAFLSALTEP